MSTNSTGTAQEPAAPPTDPAPPKEPQRSLTHRLVSGSWLVSVLAVLVALLVGVILIAIAKSDEVAATSSYFFARPADLLHVLFDPYVAMIRGSIVDWQAASAARMWRPLTETLTNSVPLILAGLGMAVAFRAGLFNIGGQGQVVLGAIVSSFIGFAFNLLTGTYLVLMLLGAFVGGATVGFAFNLPGIHMVLAVLGAAVGGAAWAAIAGVLKAKAGANEVIVTIMLNSIAALLIAYVLTLPVVIGQGNTNPKSQHVADTAAYPLLLGSGFRLHAGFLVALAAAAAVWWLLERSSIGFEFRAVGLNPAAARTAGISVAKVTVLAMIVSGALCGLAGSAPTLGTERFLTSGIAGSYGFDAITVALLGKSRPGGVVAAGILFGALKAGGTLMQTATSTPIDIVLVLQSTIVLFIAAPPLVRAMFHLPEPGAPRRRRATATAVKEAQA